MARQKGVPAYPKKAVQGSYYISKEAARKIRAASKRTGKSDSDIIEHGIMETADSITPKTPRFGPDGFKETRQSTNQE
jgi:hypothetical protein